VRLKIESLSLTSQLKLISTLRNNETLSKHTHNERKPKILAWLREGWLVPYIAIHEEELIK